MNTSKVLLLGAMVLPDPDRQLVQIMIHVIQKNGLLVEWHQLKDKPNRAKGLRKKGPPGTMALLDDPIAPGGTLDASPD